MIRSSYRLSVLVVLFGVACATVAVQARHSAFADDAPQFPANLNDAMAGVTEAYSKENGWLWGIYEADKSALDRKVFGAKSGEPKTWAGWVADFIQAEGNRTFPDGGSLSIHSYIMKPDRDTVRARDLLIEGTIDGFKMFGKGAGELKNVKPLEGAVADTKYYDLVLRGQVGTNRFLWIVDAPRVFFVRLADLRTTTDQDRELVKLLVETVRPVEAKPAE